jgi:hypothetical protein
MRDSPTARFYPYQFGVFNAGLFNTRTQGFNNTFYWGAQMYGAHLIGKYLDSRVPLQEKAVKALKVAMGGTVIKCPQSARAQIYIRS